MKRTIAAFIAAPSIPSVYFIPHAGAELAFGLTYFLSYLLGVPAFLFLRRIKQETHLNYALAGFVMGASYILLQALFEWFTGALLLVLMFGCVGSLTALVFSLLRGNERVRSNKVPQPDCDQSAA